MLAGLPIFLAARPAAQILYVWASQPVVDVLEEPDMSAAFLQVAVRHAVRMRADHRSMGFASSGQGEAYRALGTGADWRVGLMAEDERDLCHSFKYGSDVSRSRVRKPGVGEVMAGGVELKPRKKQQFCQQRVRHIVAGYRVVVAACDEKVVVQPAEVEEVYDQLFEGPLALGDWWYGDDLRHASMMPPPASTIDLRRNSDEGRYRRAIIAEL